MRNMHWLDVCLIAGVVGIVSCSSDDPTTIGRGSTSGATGGSDGTGGTSGSGGTGGTGGSTATGGGGMPTGSATTCMQRNVAVWVAHGATDTTVPTSQGRTARDHFLALNHCTMTSTATTPSPCITYGGCDSGYPVHYCEFDGGHQPPSFAGAGLWSFFSQF
jgi:hypothetical protein